jgi:glycogen(starch) synthase
LCESTVRALAARGHEMLVLTSRHGLIEGVEYPPEPCVRRIFALETPIGKTPDRSLKRRKELGQSNGALCRKALDEFKPEVVYVWNLSRLTLGPAQAAEKLGLATVFSLCDDHLTEYLPREFSFHPKQALAAWAEKIWHKECTVDSLMLGDAMCISRSLRETLSRKGLPLSHSQVFSPGIELTRFPLKNDPGGMHHPARLVFLGPLRPNKRVEVILRALGVVLERGRSQATLTIAGDGDEEYTKSLHRVAEDLGVADDVLFMGRVDFSMIPQIYRDHDIFVYASVWDEPFGLTHLEAMASGCPVISTDCGGPTEYLIHEENAILLPKDNPGAMAAAIQNMLGNNVLRRNVVKNARAAVEEKFDARNCMDDLEVFLKKAAKIS